MPTTDQDLRALTYLARRLRDETHGCTQWDEAGTFICLKDALIGQNLLIAVQRVIGHATDPEAKTPGAIKRPFVPEPQPRRGDLPPRKAEECRTHVGQWASNCGGCAADRRGADAYGHDEAAEQAATYASRQDAIDKIRASLRATPTSTTKETT